MSLDTVKLLEVGQVGRSELEALLRASAKEIDDLRTTNQRLSEIARAFNAECIRAVSDVGSKAFRQELVQIAAVAAKWIALIDHASGASGAIELPGWTCHANSSVPGAVYCGTFNGAAKEWLTHCRACGEPGPTKTTDAMEASPASEGDR